MSEHIIKPKDRNEITPTTRVPLYLLGSFLGLAIYGTIGYCNIMAKLDTSMSVQQAQDWIDDARSLNPTINWPRLPSKRSDSTIMMNTNNAAFGMFTVKK